jgi:predicted flap endonuclease-1-like 5' DNA nuclease
MRRFWLFLLGLIMALVFRRIMADRRPEPVAEPLIRPESKPPAEPAVDALTEINGIGPAFEKALNVLGIYSFADLARQNPEDLAQRLAVRVTAERIRRDAWIEQAQARAQA